MGFREDIQTIAKTKKLETDIAKIKQDVAAVKAAIGAFRTISYKLSNGNTGTISGAPSVADSEGNTVDPLIPPDLTPYVSSIPSIGILFNSNLGVNNPSTESTELGQQTDLSSSVSNGSPSGSQILELAQYGAQNAGVQDLFNLIDARTDLSPAEKVAAKRQMMLELEDTVSAIENDGGYLTVQDILDNVSFIPKIGYKLRGLIGFDSDGLTGSSGDVLGALVRLDSVYPTPIPSDATASDQGPWDWWDTPPVDLSYTAGSVWKIVYGFTSYYAQTFSALIAEMKAGSGLNYVYTLDGPGALNLITDLTPVRGEYLIFSGSGTGMIGNTAGSVGGVIFGYGTGGSQYGVHTCASQAAFPAAVTVCALSAPSVDFWPITGAYVLTNYLLGVSGSDYDKIGKFIASTFDSEAPQKFANGVSKIELAAGDGVNVIDTRKLSIETVNNGFLTYNSDGVTGNYNFYDYKGYFKGSGPVVDRTKYSPAL